MQTESGMSLYRCFFVFELKLYMLYNDNNQILFQWFGKSYLLSEKFSCYINPFYREIINCSL